MGKKSFNYTIEPWVTTDERVEYTTNIFKVLKRDMKIESEDHSATFSVLEAPDWINVIALTPENEIVLVEQYRYGKNQHLSYLVGCVIRENIHLKLQKENFWKKPGSQLMIG